MKEFDFYRLEQLNEKCYVITESYGSHSNFKIYVLIGTEKTAVIDSGLGAQSGLRNYIEEKIPVKGKLITLLTHTHPDHAGGAPLFDEIYLNRREVPDIPWNVCVVRRFGDLEHFSDGDESVQAFCRDHYVDKVLDDSMYHLIEDGDEIDLGELSLKVRKMRGHTEGSIGFYWKEKNLFFAGDSLQKDNNLKSKSMALNAMADLESFLEEMPENVIILNGHEDSPADRKLAEEMKTCIREILDGIGLENDLKKGVSKFKPVPAPQDVVLPVRGTIENYVHQSGRVKIQYNRLDFERA